MYMPSVLCTVSWAAENASALLKNVIVGGALTSAFHILEFPLALLPPSSSSLAAAKPRLVDTVVPDYLGCPALPAIK